MLKPSSNEAKALKKRLGLRRLYLRQVNLDARANAIDNQIAKLKSCTTSRQPMSIF